MFAGINMFWVRLRLILARATMPDKVIIIHIMSGYQCDKAVNKNDTREVK